MKDKTDPGWMNMMTSPFSEAVFDEQTAEKMLKMILRTAVLSAFISTSYHIIKGIFNGV